MAAIGGPWRPLAMVGSPTGEEYEFDPDNSVVIEIKIKIQIQIQIQMQMQIPVQIHPDLESDSASDPADLV
jgi:hypothetical protein